MKKTGRGGGLFGRDNCYELNDISIHTVSLIHCDIPMYSLVFFCIYMVKWILILMLQIEKRFFFFVRIDQLHMLRHWQYCDYVPA